MRIKLFLVVCAAVLSSSMSHAATIGYLSETAPDAISREILRNPLTAFEQGARSPSDVPAAIHRNLSILLEQNLASMPASTAAAWVDQLSDLELEHMAQLYVNSNASTGRSGKWLQVAALRLDSRRLARLSQFFGYNEIYTAILAVSPSKMAAFSALATTAYPPASGRRFPASKSSVVRERCESLFDGYTDGVYPFGRHDDLRVVYRIPFDASGRCRRRGSNL